VIVTVAKYRLWVYYHNDSCTAESEIVDYAYPFVNDSISVRAILGMEALDCTNYFCGLGFDPADSGQYFVNDGRWYCTGTEGSGVPAGDWNNYNWPKLSPDVKVNKWEGVPLSFSWYEINSAVDKETQLSSVHKDTYNNNTRRFFYYPPYTLFSTQNWGFSTTLSAGTHRFIVRVKRNDELSQTHFLDSLEPTPGRWNEQTVDHIHPDYTLTWSQNCDEPPNTSGPTEYSVRISVRKLSEDTWPETQIMRSYLQWLTSFIDIPYEWGGYWYGGRADDKGNVTNVDNDYEGYGIDCSGLVSAAARFAGYNWNPWRQSTSTLNSVSVEIQNPNINLRAGDILNRPYGHVVTVYQYTPGQIDQNTSRIIESSGRKDKVRIKDSVKIQDYIDTGYKARRLIPY